MRRAFVALVFGLVGLAGSPVGSSSGSEPTPVPVVGTDRPGAIDDRYVVAFRDGTTTAAIESAREQAREQGAIVHYGYGAALHGFAATLPERALETLRQNPAVEFIEADRMVTSAGAGETPVLAAAAETQTPAPWGLDRIDQRLLPLNNTYHYDYTGSGVRVYVLDTGIRMTHSEFGGRAVLGVDTVGDGQNGNDCNGHGTHVAGVIGGSTYGVAKQVQLVSVRVLNCSGSGTISGAIAGIDWVTQNHVKPAAAYFLSTAADLALDTAIQNSIAAGVVYAVAAGNSNAPACNASPGRVAAAITVGASTMTDARASFSNYGTCLDLFAPGESITSASATSDTATNTISATTLAAAHVSGAGALHLQRDSLLSPSAVRDAIVNDATAGVITDPGIGSPNLLLYAPKGPRPPVDFDGRGTTDISVFRPVSGYWFVKDGPTVQFGTAGDIPVPADFNGDGVADIAVFRPSSGYWFINNGPTVQFGAEGDIPVPADYDGDGDDDIAVFRPSSGYWFIYNGPTVQFGTAGDVPVPADWDGDGVVDLAVFRPSNGYWFIRNGPTVQFGTTGDIPAAGDFNGDGVVDIAVYRPSSGYWFVQDGTITAFGTTGDIPMVGDFNGDGRADIAVYRPSAGYWFLQDGTIVQFGTSGDIPLPLPAAIRLAFFPS